MKLYDFLRMQFNDLSGAIEFYRHWKTDREQQLPGFGGFTLRAMAAHCSLALEGKAQPETEPTSYIDTQYGQDIYFS